MTATPDEVAAWESDMIRDHDLGDLADCIQLLRSLNWSSALSFKTLGTSMFLWHEDLDKFSPVIEQLGELSRTGTEPEKRALAAALARLYGRVHDALAAGPRCPDEAEIVRRYVAGEIGDRTAQYTLGVDVWGLHEACRRHGLPPIQLGGGD
jgi:hypothetical protein